MQHGLQSLNMMERSSVDTLSSKNISDFEFKHIDKNDAFFVLNYYANH